VLSVLDAGHDVPRGRGVGLELVRHHHAGRPALLLQQLAQQALDGLGVAPALDQDIKHEAVAVDRLL